MKPTALKNIGVALLATVQLCFILHALCILYGLVSISWYKTQVDTTATSKRSFIIGLYHILIDTTYTEINFDDYTFNSCVVSGSLMKERFYAVRGMLILSGSLSGLLSIKGTSLVYLYASSSVPGALVVAYLLLILLSLLTTVIGLGLFSWLMESYIFCSLGSCNFVSSIFGNGKCVAVYGPSFVLISCSMIFLVAAWVLVIIWKYFCDSAGGRPPSLRDVTPHVGETRGLLTTAAAATPYHQAQQPTTLVSPQPQAYPTTSNPRAVSHEQLKPNQQPNTVAPQILHQHVHAVTPTTAEKMLPEGDWVLDAESGLHWCEEQYLFFHLESGQFYDPNSDQWFDPERNEWYKT